MNSKAMFFIFLSVFAGLNMGSIRRNEDPIRDTQTNPILYEQKKEEEKDGKKGPLMYHVKNNPHESFFIDPPFEKEKRPASQATAPENAASSKGISGWWEEQSTESQPVSPDGRVSESLPEAGKTLEDQGVKPSAATPEAEDAASGKGDDSWW